MVLDGLCDLSALDGCGGHVSDGFDDQLEELRAIDLKYPDRDAKNLFVRDDKKTGWYLITVMGDKRVDLNGFRKKVGLRMTNR